MTDTFNIGDIVTPASAYHLSVVRDYTGMVKDDLYTVTRINDAYGEIRVSRTDTQQEVGTFSTSRFKLAPVRVEGMEIRPEDIKVGDEILVTKTRDGFTQMRQGVVGGTKRQSHNRAIGNEGAILFYTKGEYSDTKDRLNWGEYSGEVFTLIKAAPERDLLLDRLVGSIGGTAILFRESLARKQNDEKWTMVTGANLNVMTTEGLRTYIKDSTVTWLKAEG